MQTFQYYYLRLHVVQIIQQTGLSWGGAGGSRTFRNTSLLAQTKRNSTDNNAINMGGGINLFSGQADHNPWHWYECMSNLTANKRQITWKYSLIKNYLVLAPSLVLSYCGNNLWSFNLELHFYDKKTYINKKIIYN